MELLVYHIVSFRKILPLWLNFEVMRGQKQDGDSCLMAVLLRPPANPLWPRGVTKDTRP